MGCHLYGTITNEEQTHILIDVLPNNGHAPQVGLSGPVWFAKRQIVQHPQTDDGFDHIECSIVLASLKAEQIKSHKLKQ